MNNRPPSGRRSKTTSSKLLNKEQEFKELNAALEEKTASLINDAESILRGQESIFGDVDVLDSDRSELSSYRENVVETNKPQLQAKSAKTSSVTKKKPGIQNRQRPSSAVYGSKKSTTANKQPRAPCKRPQSSKAVAKPQNKVFDSPIDLIEERATLADRINTLELEAADDFYTPSKMNDGVLPDVVDDMGSDATIRFLKAKLRVMQEELDNVAVECRNKSSTIAQLQAEIKEKDEREVHLTKKNESLQSIIEKHKSTQDEIRGKNTHLDTELTSLRKEVDTLKRERKQTSANKNTLEVRLNRALEDAEKHKLSLVKSKESSKASNDTDRKRFDQLQNENKRLEKQKNELMTAFKKQLKLIDILKRQKMHIEAAKMLEFSEEEFIRALDWGK